MFELSREIRLANVEDFHVKFGFPVGKNLCDEDDSTFPRGFGTGLLYMAKGLVVLANDMGEQGDERMRRVQLMIEELSEVIVALDNKDPKELADALTDLDYVVAGTAVTYGIPLPDCHEEVHRSNMSKTRDADDSRMKAKDPARGYFPPDLAAVLARHMPARLHHPSDTGMEEAD